MKKLIPSLAIMGLLGVMLVPMLASAQVVVPDITTCTIRHTFQVGSGAGATQCTAGQNPCNLATDPNCGTCCTLDKIYTITDWIFLIVIALAVIFIILAAINFITAGGSPEKAATARQMLIYAAIGIIVALLAKALPFIIKSILNLG